MKGSEMGLDMTHQALPDDPAWWARILADEETRDGGLGLLPFYLTRTEAATPWAGKIGAEAEALRQARPGIEKRNFRLERWWDKLHFLLSEARQGGADGGDDPGTIAIRGERVVTWNGADVTATQGMPVRYTTPYMASLVALTLDETTEDDLQAQFDVPAMERGGVYKGASEDDFDVLLGYFHGLRRFYREVAAHGEGVLVCLD